MSDVWMQERYQLERALRLRLERCEAERDGTGSVSALPGKAGEQAAARPSAWRHP